LTASFADSGEWERRAFAAFLSPEAQERWISDFGFCVVLGCVADEEEVHLNRGEQTQQSTLRGSVR